MKDFYYFLYYVYAIILFLEFHRIINSNTIMYLILFFLLINLINKIMRYNI